MRSTAVAVATAFALGGCAPEEWSFESARDSVGDAEAAAPAEEAGPVESGADESPLGCSIDCAQFAQVCDVTMGQCVGCVDDSQCTNPTPVCSQNVCVECVRSADCPKAGPGTVPVCDVTQCAFSCADGGGGVCPANQHRCNTLRPEARCAECLVDSDCADAGPGRWRCDNGSGACTDESASFSPVDEGGGAPDSSEAETEASSDASSGGDARDGE